MILVVNDTSMVACWGCLQDDQLLTVWYPVHEQTSKGAAFQTAIVASRVRIKVLASPLIPKQLKKESIPLS